MQSKPDVAGLLQMINAGKALEAIQILERHPELVNADLDPNGSRNKLVHAVAESSCQDVLRYLLENGVDVDTRGSENQTPLHDAAWVGGSVAIEVLLDHGADIEALDVYGFTPIDKTYKRTNRRAFETLLRRGAKPGLFIAVAHDRMDLVERLVRDVSAEELRRRVPDERLMFVCAEGCADYQHVSTLLHEQGFEDAPHSSIKETLTEEEWSQSRDSLSMFEYLRVRGAITDRKQRLLVCAVARSAWPILDVRGRKAIEVSERFADGNATAEELAEVQQAARRAMFETADASPERKAALAAYEAAGSKTIVAARSATTEGLTWAHHPAGTQEILQGRAEVAVLLREIFGNPFETMQIDSRRRTPKVVKLARAAYDEREGPTGHLACSRLARVADALAEVGCTAGTLLEHLRSEGPHFRGCFAVDQILGQL